MTKIQEVKILPEAEKKADVHFVFQIAIATSDMEGLLNNWKNLFNIDDSAVIKRCTKDLFDKGEFDGGNYYGSPCQFFIKYCRFDLGNMDIEIIEPLDKNPGNPYSDFLIRNGKERYTAYSRQNGRQRRLQEDHERYGDSAYAEGRLGKT